MVLSPDKNWLAVCKDHVVKVYSMAALVCDGLANPVAEWDLPKFTKLKEVISTPSDSGFPALAQSIDNVMTITHHPC